MAFPADDGMKIRWLRHAARCRSRTSGRGQHELRRGRGRNCAGNYSGQWESRDLAPGCPHHVETFPFDAARTAGHRAHTHTANAGTRRTVAVAGLMYRWLTPATLIGKPARMPLFLHSVSWSPSFIVTTAGRRRSYFSGLRRLLARLAPDRIIVISNQQLREI